MIANGGVMQLRNQSVIRAMVGVFALLAAIRLESVYAQSLDKPVWPTKEWLESTPEQQGMDSSALAKLVTNGASRGFDNLLVVRHGRIVTEAYYAPYTAELSHQIHSSTKAIISTMIGMLFKDGVLDRLDHPVLDFFADRHIANVDSRKNAITIQNLLDMTSGFDWDQGIEDGKEQTLINMTLSSNWTQFILDCPMAHAPGEVFNYTDANPNLASAIITRLTGKLAEDYAREKLFGPLGITNWHWDRDPQGLTMGAWTLTMLPRDMAKIGYLYLHGGEWEGRQLLPVGWADVLNHASVDMRASVDRSLRYSNFFWVFPERHVYMAVGWHGQLIAVFPDLDIVAVVTAHKFVRFGDVIDGVSGAVKSDSALPPSPTDTELLANAIKDVAVEKSTAAGPAPEIASAISGKTYKFPDNALGLKSFTLFLIDSHPRYEFEINLRHPINMYNISGIYDAQLGLEGNYRKSAPRLWGANPGHITAAKGAWLNGQTFEIDSGDLGFGGMSKYLLSFNGKKLNFVRADEWGRKTSIQGEQGD
jgi:CubicO group peptidase (beta-lactamase class C family)